MKKGDKILIKATNEIAIIRDFQKTGSKKCFLYADIGDKGAVYYMDEFYLLIEPMSHSEFMNFLDNNPPNETEETPELTEKEQHLVWQADLDAHNQMVQDENNFHL